MKDKMTTNKSNLIPECREKLIIILQTRFKKNMDRHKGLEWTEVQSRMATKHEKLWSLNEMEETGGEPDVVGYDDQTGEFIFYDCSKESPKGRRSVCYDDEALESRKEHKPRYSALGMAAEMGVDLLTEEQYRGLQRLGDFDTKTSSWIETPRSVRQLGGAIFGDHRFGRTFFYHNGAESYYGARGFRASLRI